MYGTESGAGYRKIDSFRVTAAVVVIVVVTVMVRDYSGHSHLLSNFLATNIFFNLTLILPEG